MADANGIIFKNPTLNLWFVAPSVDLTAWNVITVSDCTDAAFNLDYTYVSATAKWTNGIRNIWKDTLWYMSDGTTTYTAPDNGKPTPPATFSFSIEFPQTITAAGAGSTQVNIEYAYFDEYNGRKRWWDGTNTAKAIYFDGTRWNIWSSVLFRYANDSMDTLPPKTGWYVYGVASNPAPILEYTTEYTATVSPASSTTTWASNNPTSGFISLTAAPDEDFGYVITFDVQGGAPYPYYKYVTKTAGEVYGLIPALTRDGYYFAGVFTGAGGTGTQATSVTPLIVAANDTLYARWIPFLSGRIGCAASLLSFFTLGAGTDFFCESTATRIATSVASPVLRSIPPNG